VGSTDYETPQYAVPSLLVPDIFLSTVFWNIPQSMFLPSSERPIFTPI